VRFLIAFVILSVVVYGRFYIRARRANAYDQLAQRENLLAEREADRGIVRKAFVQYEHTRERLYSMLNVPYAEMTYLQPHAVEMAEARDKAAADPNAWATRMVIDSHEVADRVYHEVCAEWDLKYPGVSVD